MIIEGKIIFNVFNYWYLDIWMYELEYYYWIFFIVNKEKYYDWLMVKLNKFLILFINLVIIVLFFG